ncbi:hypothetical protein DL96DRAFT_1574637 [Flagelloscypha sp. PMI_526]|nr:hypothetical protein DL96DRAFT_1574637 [Flagelloscypha sp. PMI_526]
MEPMWYCHECHAEMRPLMQPDPHCASCRGTFVEKMDDPADDPREFEQGDVDLNGMPPAIELFMNALQSFAQPNPNRQRQSRSPNPSGGVQGACIFRSRPSSGSGPRTIHIGSPPTMSEFNRSGQPGDGITGNLMAQYLMAMLGGGLERNGPMPDFFSQLADPTQQGRMGDYVFNQEALDQIMTQLMENSNAHKPVPAPEEMINKLPREVLEEGSPTLEKDCATLMNKLSLPLPCNHPFHAGCIEPWLKSSGTCPVCSSRVPSLFSNIFGGGGSNSPPAGGNNNSSSDSGSDSPNPPGGWR